MRFEDEIGWWILAGVLFAAELLSGSFYLLLLAVVALLTGFVAWFDVSPIIQSLMAALMSLAGVSWLRQHKRKPSGNNNNITSEIGACVEVDCWKSAQHVRVRYRGSLWDAELVHPVGEDRPQYLYIVGTRANTLLVDIKAKH